jgi:hypothetical protein
VSQPLGCPLCASDDVTPLAHAHGRDFIGCADCGLAFVEPSQRPPAAAERARYETHENDPSDAGYRAFLGRLFEPLAARLPPGAEGLDYGSGPGPTLSLMLREAGFPTAIYDPYFAPDLAAFERTYDFVTCTETAEHFFAPAAEFDRLDALLRPGGWLAVMTTILTDEQALETWWYARDPTHVCFYRAETMEWIARRYGWLLERTHANVALFRKASA